MNLCLALLLAVLVAAEPVAPQEQGDADRLARLSRHMELAARARAEGRMAQAVEHVQKALGLAAGDLEALRHLASSAQEYRFYPVVEKVCVDAMKLAPDDPFFPGKYGEALIGMQRHDEAVVQLAAAVKTDPENPDWWASLGLARLHRYEVDESFSAIGRALALRPGDPGILAIRAEAEIRTLRFADCERTCMAILETTPHNQRAALLLVRARRRLQRHGDALEAANEALKRFGENGAFLLERGRVLLEAGELEKAATDLERATVLLGSDPHPWVHLTLVYTRLGLKEKAAAAREEYERLERLEAQRRRG